MVLLIKSSSSKFPLQDPTLTWSEGDLLISGTKILSLFKNFNFPPSHKKIDQEFYMNYLITNKLNPNCIMSTKSKAYYEWFPIFFETIYKINWNLDKLGTTEEKLAEATKPVILTEADNPDPILDDEEYEPRYVEAPLYWRTHTVHRVCTQTWCQAEAVCS